VKEMSLQGNLHSALSTFLFSAQTGDATFYCISAEVDDERGFAYLLGLDKAQYLRLMGALQLATFNKRHKQFTFSQSNLEGFIVNCSLQSFCSTTQAQYKGKTRALFLQIGTFPDGVEKHTPLCSPIDRQLPTVENLKVKQLHLKEELCKLLDFAATLTFPVPSATTPPPTQPTPPATEEENFLLACLERQLLPLLLPKETAINKKINTDNLPLTQIAAAITEIAQALVKERQKRRSRMISDTVMTPNDSLDLPTFKEFGIDASNKRVVSGLVTDIITLSSQSTKHSILTTRMANSQSITLVRVPQCSSLDRLERNARQLGFINQLVTALVANESPKKKAAGEDLFIGDGKSFPIYKKEDAVLAFLVCMGKQYGDIFKKACTHLDFSVKESMDDVATFSMWSQANINYSQQRVVARHLQVWFGRMMLCSEEKLKKSLGNDFVGAEEVGIYLHNNIKIPWSCRNPMKVLKHYLECVLNGNDKSRACQLTHVDCLLSLDHGQGFCRASAVFVCRVFDEATQKWREFQETFLLASAETAKDDGEILSSTFMPTLNKGFEEMVQRPAVHVYKREIIIDERKTNYICLKGEEKENTSDVEVYSPIKLECWVAADCKQYMMNQGRENFSSRWCPYCDCSHKDWQFLGHTKGTAWTLLRLTEFCKTVSDEMTPDERKGVNKTPPLLTAIDIDHQLPPALHLELGAGNGVEKNLIPEIQAACEKWSEDYLKLERRLERLNSDLGLLQTWKKDAKNRVLIMNNERKIGTSSIGNTRRKRPCTVEETAELALLKTKLTIIQKLLDEDKELIAGVKKAFLIEKKKAENSKAQGQPVRTQIEVVLKAHGINKGVYFGGDLQGEAVRRLMKKRESIMEGLRELILSLPEDQKFLDDLKVFDMLNAYERLLGHFDGLFSICRVKRFQITNDQLTNAGKHCLQILLLWRALGLSVTVKLHIIEDHVMDYLNKVKGIGDLTEDEGERAHQIGKGNEHRSKNASDNATKANSHARWESMQKREEVIERKKIVEQAVKRKSSSELRGAKAKKSKEERDEGRVNLFDLGLVPERYETLAEQRKKKIVENGPVRTDIFQADFTIE
jgi:hypothetical protein